MNQTHRGEREQREGRGEGCRRGGDVGDTTDLFFWSCSLLVPTLEPI